MAAGAAVDEAMLASSTPARPLRSFCSRARLRFSFSSSPSATALAISMRRRSSFSFALRSSSSTCFLRSISARAMLLSLPLVVAGAAAALEGVEFTWGALAVRAGLARRASGTLDVGIAAAFVSIAVAFAVLLGAPLDRGWNVPEAEILV